ncbi:hypothetical protein H5410_038190 [Solanum commersonii]|uniref:Uncharacterized protein n=1 Tax=Solanum commersonii TaxID=4109 RepID=A0A9J5YD96_SOLCO|nr:hypothetical protein H5410_038190 [Solanum commersonii]
MANKCQTDFQKSFSPLQQYISTSRRHHVSNRRNSTPVRTQLYSHRLLPFPRQTVRLVLFQPFPAAESSLLARIDATSSSRTPKELELEFKFVGLVLIQLLSPFSKIPNPIFIQAFRKSSFGGGRSLFTTRHSSLLPRTSQKAPKFSFVYLLSSSF